MRTGFKGFKVCSAARIINLFFQEFQLAIKVSRGHNKARRRSAAARVTHRLSRYLVFILSASLRMKCKKRKINLSRQQQPAIFGIHNISLIALSLDRIIESARTQGPLGSASD